MFNKEEMKEETGKHHGTISSFQAVSAALAAVLGTGNIVGVEQRSQPAVLARSSGCGLLVL